MHDPFKIDGPACVSFSGGRTSAYMLWRIVEAHGGQLPDDVVVCFANTGKEEEATLRFVRDCELNWGVRIVWLEYLSKATAPLFKVVSFGTASRNGEPLERVFDEHLEVALPNPVARFCTSEAKIRTIRRYLQAKHGWGPDDFDMVLGIRADEPRRVAKLGNTSDKRDGIRIAPLARAGITAKDVGVFWQAQPFDLGLKNIDGVAPDGNCDLCFLKPAARIQSLIAARPTRAIWWIRQEERRTANGQPARFRQDRPTYAQMAAYAEQQHDMFDKDEEAIACFCGD